MSDLLDLRDKLQDTSAMLSRAEKAIKNDPSLDSVQAVAESFRRRQAKLEKQFLEEAAKVGVEVVSYRLFAEDQPKLAGVAAALGDFQNLVTVAYDAEKNGARKNTRVAAESVKESSFDFAYTYPGSLGVVLTIADEALLIGEANLERAMADIFAMAKVGQPEQIKEYAKRLGVAVVLTMYRWASHHVQYGLGADIAWRRGDEVRSKLFIQLAELAQLTATIDRTSDEVHEDLVVVGVFLGGDYASKRFHLKLDDGTDISGRFADAITEERKGQFPERCRATLQKTTTIKYSTEEESVTYFLSLLEPPV